MESIKSFWKETKEQFDKLEKSLIDCYIGFLREVGRVYLQQGRRVFFKENRVVHWGEENFGKLVIEGNEDVDEVFDDYISEIYFEPEINEKIVRGCVEIKMENLKDIKYKP